jgi:hypothetical protein
MSRNGRLYCLRRQAIARCVLDAERLRRSGVRMTRLLWYFLPSVFYFRLRSPYRFPSFFRLGPP